MNAPTTLKAAAVTLDAEELRQALKLLGRVYSRRATIPVLQTVLVETNQDNSGLRMTATDLDLYLSIELRNTGIDRSFRAAIPLETLAAVARHAVDPVGLWIDPYSGRLKVCSDFMTADLNLLAQPEDFPLAAAEPKGEPLQIGEADLARMLHLCAHCISKQETRYYLNGVFFTQDPKAETLRTVATDGHRMAVIDSDQNARDLGNFILPHTAVATLRQICRAKGNRTIELYRTDMRARFVCDNVTLNTKLIDGTYPDYARVIPDQEKEAVGRCTLNKAATQRLSAMAIAMGGDFSRPVRLDPETGTLETRGWSGSTVTMPMTGAGDTAITFNLDYVNSQMSVTPTAEIKWHSENVAAIVRGEDPKAFWVLMPMRW